jgi:hypothetical protein
MQCLRILINLLRISFILGALSLVIVEHFGIIHYLIVKSKVEEENKVHYHAKTLSQSPTLL